MTPALISPVVVMVVESKELNSDFEADCCIKPIALMGFRTYHVSGLEKGIIEGSIM